MRHLARDSVDKKLLAQFEEDMYLYKVRAYKRTHTYACDRKTNVTNNANLARGQCLQGGDARGGGNHGIHKEVGIRCVPAGPSNSGVEAGGGRHDSACKESHESRAARNPEVLFHLRIVQLVASATVRGVQKTLDSL